MRRTLSRRGRTLLALGVSLGAAFAIFWAARLWVQATQERAAERRALDMATSLSTGLASPIEALHALQAFFETPRSGGLSLAQFQAFCRPAVARHPAIVALEWFPLVRKAQRAAFERWVALEQAGFQAREPTRAGAMVTAVERELHVPLTYAEPANPVVQGLDLAFDPVRIAPLERAMQQGITTLSDRFQLVEDPAGVYSVVAYAPVFRAAWVNDVNSAGAAFEQGVVVALFRLNHLSENALRQKNLAGIAFTLEDPNAAEELRLLYRSQVPPRGIGKAAEVQFADKTYRLTVFSNDTRFVALPWAAFFASLLLGVALTAFLDARFRTRHLERAIQRLGQYHLEGRIASGGMGTVYRARHALLRRPTAIKIAHEDQTTSHFEKEVLLTSALTHPNTIQVYDFGKGEDGSFYYAMEYIEGYDFEQLIQRGGPLPAARVIRLLLQAAGSLEEAHRAGLVHRDVKPSNLMLTERGGVKDFVKVLDFGLAKRQAVPSLPTAHTANPSVAFAGTPGYVAPEVVAGTPATPLSDIFSLGCVAYFLLAGQPPFAATSATEALTMVLTAEPALLPANVPAALAELVRACLSKKPEQRPASMQSLAERLKVVLPQCPAWTQQDAEQWWLKNPPAVAERTPSGSASFFLRERRSRSSDESQRSGA